MVPRLPVPRLPLRLLLRRGLGGHSSGAAAAFRAGLGEGGADTAAAAVIVGGRRATASTTATTTTASATAIPLPRGGIASRGFATSRQQRHRQKEKHVEPSPKQPPHLYDNASAAANANGDDLISNDYDDDNDNDVGGGTRDSLSKTSRGRLGASATPAPTVTLREGDARALVELERRHAAHPLLYETASVSSSVSSSSPSSRGRLSGVSGAVVPSFLPKTWDPSVYEKSTPLWEHLSGYVAATGRPVSVATYMRWCLTHPEYGYYNTRPNGTIDDFDDDDDIDDIDNDDDAGTELLKRHVIGRDFVTAPEITSLFGECLAAFFASHLERRLLNSREHSSGIRYRWVECGPGRGTLMRDLLEASAPLGMLEMCESIHLVEASRVLREAQRRALEELAKTTLPVQFRFVANMGYASDQLLRQGTDGSVPSTTDPSVHEITVVWHDALTDVLQWSQQQQQEELEQQRRQGPNEAQSPLLTFGICQEFIDALPVYSFQKTPEGWRERMVDLAMEDEDDHEGGGEAEESEKNTSITIAALPASSSASKPPRKVLKPRLRVVLAPEVTPPVRTLLRTNEEGRIPGEDPEAGLGSVVEVNPEGVLLVRDMAALIGSEESGGGGAALVIDYGGEGSGDSIRAYSRHEQLPFLSLPGLVDVTADVDFAALKNAVNCEPPRPRRPGAADDDDDDDDVGTSTEPDSARGPWAVHTYGPVTQGEFLMSMGLQERVVAVIEDDRTDDDHAENLYQAMVRLAAPEEMGERFKVLAIVSRDPNDENQDPPPGFPPT